MPEQAKICMCIEFVKSSCAKAVGNPAMPGWHTKVTASVAYVYEASGLHLLHLLSGSLVIIHRGTCLQVIAHMALHAQDKRLQHAAVRAVQGFCIANPEGQLALLSDLPHSAIHEFRGSPSRKCC